MLPKCVTRVWSQIFKKWQKPDLKIFLRKSLNFSSKTENFLTLIILKMSWLATWFIFELIGVGNASNLSEPRAFKNVSLQVMIDKTLPFRRIFHKKLHHI